MFLNGSWTKPRTNLNPKLLAFYDSLAKEKKVEPKVELQPIFKTSITTTTKSKENVKVNVFKQIIMELLPNIQKHKHNGYYATVNGNTMHVKKLIFYYGHPRTKFRQ